MDQNQAYDSVKKLIYAEVARHYRRHGRDWDALLSEANWIYTRCVATYDPAKGALTTLLTTSIRRRLSTFTRRQQKMESLDQCDANGQPFGESIEQQVRASFDGDSFCAQLSDDARTVARLVCRAPDEVHSAVFARGPRRSAWRTELAAFLRDLGWDSRRITNSFSEISAVL